MNPPENDSSDLFDLPEVPPGEGPVRPEPPSWDDMIAHAKFLLESGGAEARLRRTPSQEPFVWD